jgi:FHA domain
MYAAPISLDGVRRNWRDGAPALPDPPDMRRVHDLYGTRLTICIDVPGPGHCSPEIDVSSCLAMSITTPHEPSVSTGERISRRPVGGLRILGTRALYLLAEIRYRQFPKSYITIGRVAERDIRIRDSSVSRHHCTIVRMDDGGWALSDAGSRNGVLVREPAAGARFRRVFHVALAVGMQVRLGPVTLLVTDARGQCPMVIDSAGDFCHQLVAVYGSRRAAARAIGLPRRVLDRLLAAAKEGSR